MLYAKVVVGLPVAGPFDYVIEPELQGRLQPGCRVWVPWRNQRRLGYVVGLSKKTKIRKVKPIISAIDDTPVLDKNMLILTKQLSDYYCCSWGEAIETALPQGLRKGKSVTLTHINSVQNIPVAKERNLLIHDLERTQRWDIYLKEIKEALAKNKSVIMLFPDKQAVLKASEIIGSKIKARLSILCREGSGELQEWVKAKQGQTDIVVATRSGIFAPLDNLGLVIIDEEESPVYKQDQVPHYHPREIAFMRVKLQGARIILAGICVSLESFYLTKKSRLKYLHLERRKKYPELQITGMKHSLRSQKKGVHPILSKYLQDSVALSLDSKDKILLFLNRRGFATGAFCISCGLSLRCPRCSVNLVYHFKDNRLKCHYCNFKLEPPKICPNCNAGYIKYSGAGAEKIESEISRIYPEAAVGMLQRHRHTDITQADIFISSQGALAEANYNFGLIGILSIDSSLNRVDFRAAEKTYQLLNNILRLTDKRLIIQTNLANHHIFTALQKQDSGIFYKKELSQRRQLNFPPYQHLGLIKIRGKNEEKVEDTANALFSKLKEANTAKNIDIISVNCSEPAKLRGNFYWQILLRSNSAMDLSKFLKMRLKDAPHSGIIITVDIDPL